MKTSQKDRFQQTALCLYKIAGQQVGFNPAPCTVDVHRHSAAYTHIWRDCVVALAGEANLQAEKVQRMACVAITGAQQSTPVEEMFAVLDLPHL